MITLRCTKKLRQHLGVKPEPEDIEPTSALGDWYGNLVFMPEGPPLVLICNESTLLSVVLRHDADVLAEFKQRAVALLRRLELPKAAVEQEAFHLQRIRTCKTRNRRVLGSMNEAVLLIKTRLSDNQRDQETLEQAEDVLAENLYSMLKYEPPAEVARRLLGAPPRPRPARPPTDGAAAKPASKNRPAPEPDDEEGVALAMELLAPALDGPPPKRTKIAEGQKVPVKLTARDRDLIIECAGLSPDITGPLAKVPFEVGTLNIGYTLDDLDEMRGCIAAEASHSKDRNRQKVLDGLYRRIQEVMESYDDGSCPF